MNWKSRAAEPATWFAGKLAGHGADPRSVPPRDILVLRTTDLGDLLTTTPIFAALRSRFPESKLVAGIGSWGRPILEGNPFVDEIAEIDLPFSNKFVPDQSPASLLRFLARSPQLRDLRRRGGFDVGIDILGSHVTVLALLRLGARYRIGLRGYRGGSSACQQSADWTDNVHVSTIALQQAELLGAQELPALRPQLFLQAAEREAAARIWAEGGLSGRHKLLINCGGGLAEKRWPAQSLIRCLALLSDAPDGTRPEMLLVGGPGDKANADTVLAAGIAGVRSVCGRVGLRTSFALAEQADFVLTNASMLLHAAATFQRPTLVVLGGMHADQAVHDRLWGYPPPYASIGVEEAGTWPAAEKVASAIRAMLAATPQRHRAAAWTA